VKIRYIYIFYFIFAMVKEIFEFSIISSFAIRYFFF
jgi:hypothetical protein